jgi:flagellum-specific ATP synthase
MERAGTSDNGSITAIYTVLVEGDDADEPIADATRGILDGHIMLSRDLAAKNHYPCIEIGHSVSRLFTAITTKTHQESVGRLREILARYYEAEDLINIGAYVKGSNPKIDDAIEKIDDVTAFLKQGTLDVESFDTTVQTLQSLF